MKNDETRWRPFEPGTETRVRSESVTWVESNWSPYGLGSRHDDIDKPFVPKKGLVYRSAQTLS